MKIDNNSPIPYEWYESIVKSQTDTNILLPRGVEHYTVVTLNKYTKSNMLGEVLSMDFLELLNQSEDVDNRIGWADMGDKALVLLGIFPEFVQQRGYTELYYSLGLSSYASSGTNIHRSMADYLYDAVKVIQGVRV